ncbi:hypothetical protein KFE25_001175 [Diacronema lutheri]|uniref:Uncharacterized protein n=1 Tax=Diacronema lutheri TaxID=2081491 RepID=A0A8J6C840_DIALT|nr:hypothetical protein KFE25_001175 [Diacronema lutheri]
MAARMFGRSLRHATRHLSSDGRDPTPPDFAQMMNALSAKSAAAIERQAKDALPPAHRPSTADASAHGRLDELQLQRLLAMQRDGADAAHVHAAARELGVKEADPALAAALEQLRAPVVMVDVTGNRAGFWSRPNLGEFARGRE